MLAVKLQGLRGITASVKESAFKRCNRLEKVFVRV